MSVNDSLDAGADVTAVETTGAVGTSTRGSRAPGMVRVNLLPPEIGEARTLRKVKVGSGVGVVLAALVVTALWWQQGQQLDQAKSDLAAAQARNTQLKAEQARLGNVDALFAQVDKAEAMLRSASAYEIHMSDYLAELSMRLTKDTYFSSVAIAETPGGLALPSAVTGAPAAAPAAASGVVANGVAAATTPPSTTAPASPRVPGAAVVAGSLGTVSITGVSYVHNDVAAWLESFAQLKGVTGVYLGNSTEELVGNTLSTVKWSSTAQLTLEALFHAPSTNGGTR